MANGVVEALLLPFTMSYNAPMTKDRLTLIAELLDPGSREAGSSAERAVTLVRNLLTEAGVPQRLRDVKVTEEAIVDVAEHALNDWSITRVPRPVDRDALRQLLQTAR